MTNITLYKYDGEKNRMQKTLSDGETIQINFNRNYDVIHPIIKLSIFNNTYNYCYIESMNRYYFIDSVDIVRAGLYELHLSLDVLQTYKDEILKQSGTVTESKTSNYMNGANIPVDSKPLYKEYDFTDNFNHNGVYVMIVSGYKA